MSKRKFTSLQRKTISGDFEFKKYIRDIYHLNKISYDEFLQKDIPQKQRKHQGLEKVFSNFFPIFHQKTKMKVDYCGYSIASPKTTPEDCVIRGANYGGTLRVFLKATNTQTNEIQDIDSCLGEIPLMTEEGTFIINGHEKVFISQMQKCPGVIFSKEVDTSTFKKHATAKIYPSIGSWVHLKVEKYISVSIDKKKKFGVTSFLLCFAKKLGDGFTQGYDIKEILDNFYSTIDVEYDNGFWVLPFNRDKHQKIRLEFDVYVGDKQIAKRGEILTDESYNALNNIEKIKIPYEHIGHLFMGEDIFDKHTGEIYVEVGENASVEKLNILREKRKFKVYRIDNDNPPYVLNSLAMDKITTKDEALNLWATSIKIGVHYGAIGLCMIFNTRFSDKRYYDFGAIGRKRINQILALKHDESFLTCEDVMACIKELILVAEDKREEDDIDSLANKVLVGVGPIVENYFRLGLIKFEKNLRERIYNVDVSNAKTTDIFNLKMCLYSVLDGFYRSAQMHDDNNRLSKIAQLRKLSSVGQGIGKERIAIGLRDTNESMFGKICAVQTPEGKKIGVIGHTAIYSTIDQFGFLQTPYHIVKDGIADLDIVYLTAFEEKGKIISSKRLFKKVEKDGKIVLEAKSEYLVGRKGNDTGFFHKSKVNLINIADNQIFSISASLVPFPGNNDAYRLLSGANMNIQATPLVKPESPFVGTGMEDIVGDRIIAKNSGIVKYVDCTRIVIELDDSDEIVDVYNLIFNKKTNSETCITHRPLVDIGDKIKAGDLIADGFSTLNGEIALGKNLLVCYMSHPFCYEDAFVLSERLVAEDELTSIHIQSHTCTVYETRNGPEKVTKDVPRVHSELLKNLDEFGVINIGVQVKGGDIIVGKVTPSSASAELSSEYRLLNIIFGEKASEYTDSSLRIPHGDTGFVTGVRIITRKGTEKTGTAILQEKLQLDQINRDVNEKINVIKQSLINKIAKIISGEKLEDKLGNQKKGSVIKVENDFLDLIKNDYRNIPIREEKLKELSKIFESFKFQTDSIITEKNKKISVLKSGYVLPEGVLAFITIDVSTKKIIEPGDKLAGRYGNKGVISAIYAEADMPYLKDGTPVDMIINPCGILSRMNIGQVLETTVGYGIFSMRSRLKKLMFDYYNANEERKNITINRMKECLNSIMELQNLTELGFKNPKISELNHEETIELCNYFYENGIRVRCEHFSQFSDEDMSNFLEDFWADQCGKVELYDGKTGEKYHGKVLVGYELIMKLCHLVSKKIHARSIGPYSLVSQQPMGGRARFGGQRCGEMEVWALEGSGAAFNVNELLTSKSDDEKRRKQLFMHLTKVHRYSLIIIGNAANKVVGESFKLLMYELRAAGFDLFLVDDNGQKINARF